MVSEPSDLVDCSAKVVHMAHRPGTSGQAQIFNPSIHLVGLPLFQEVPYFEKTWENPVYAEYSDPRSAIYIGLIDFHLERLKLNFQGPYPGFNFPHIESILDIIEERKRHLLLEDILTQEGRRPDIYDVLKRHRSLLLEFLQKLRQIKITLNKTLPDKHNLINSLLAQYYEAYEHFCLHIPEHIASFQEAMTFANQENLIPEPVKPYLRPIPEIPVIHGDVLELQIDIREEVSNIMKLLADPSNGDATNPSYYLLNIRTLVNDFPIQQWNPEYIIMLFKIIQNTLDNYSTEEFLKDLHPYQYAIYVDHRKLIMGVYYCMQHIQGYHRHFRWAQFQEAYGTDPKGYFLVSFNRLLRAEEGYKASIQQGLIEIGGHLAKLAKQGTEPSSSYHE